MKNKKIIKISFLFSLLTAIFYYFYINIPTDSLILFIPNKLFLGYWLKKGILPLYNPYIFLGTPFAFDIGLGNLHPFNIFFILPYPFSFSLWILTTVFIFTYGFLSLFYSLNKNLKWSLLLFLMLFFSGQGPLIRLNNPTIWAVISHYGIFLCSLKSLKGGDFKAPLFWGILLALAGHFQMVLYGFILGFIVSLFIYKIKFQKIVKFFLILSLSIFPYLLFALPQIAESTRLTASKAYTKSAALSPLHLFQLLLPFIFGNIKEGARWMIGQVENIVSSVLFIALFTIYISKFKKNSPLFLTLTLLLLSTFAYISIPFLRNYQQTYTIIFIFILTLFAKDDKFFISKLQKFTENKVKLALFFGLLSLFILSVKILFPFSFKLLLINLHKYPHPFFDQATIKAISGLLVKSLLPWLLLNLILLLAPKKNLYSFLILFVTVEGFFLNYYHNLFIPQKIIKNALSTNFPKELKKGSYKIQNIIDTYPYTGFHAYMSGLLIRPPFSKEKDFFKKETKQNYPYLQKILKGPASNWNMLFSFKSVQGYATFVPKNISDYFSKPSKDYKQKYAEILAKNPLLGQSEKGININFIAGSRITFSDPRWENLGVKYILSPFPLKDYENLTFVKQLQNNYLLYKTKSPKGTYTLYTKSEESNLNPDYQDPNKTIIKLKEPLEKPAELFVLEQAGGKIVKANGKNLRKITKNIGFSTILPAKTDTIIISYSPVQHLVETSVFIYNKQL